ncbi:MAG: 2-oxo acid dehydrogenase subunit E2 [Anaerolineales bacterium]|jgi:pyruvate dehydrogenase E2 component (dihydrolipoamide acetyltransferase)|nr:2-oxo acid dehydrogenase subunit E2 [Anaerolineales bacterium]
MAEIVIMPKLGFDMAEGTLVRWVIGEGKEVSKGAVLAEIETDKATVEVESPFGGVVVRHLVPQGEIVPVNTPIAVIASAGEKVDYEALGLAAETAPSPAGGAVPSIPETSAAPVQVEQELSDLADDGRLPGGVKASPLARRVAEEKNIDLRLVKGTGPGGRITRKDVEAFTPAPEVITAAAPKPAASTTPIPVVSGEAIPDQSLPVSRLRAAIIRRMVEAKQQIPHFYVTHEYDMAELMRLRKQVNALLPEDQKISVNDFIIKAAALALRSFPNLNASLDASKNQIVQFGRVNIGVAVAVENGLLTVVSKDADRKPLRQIAVEVRGMAARARENKVRPEDIEGSTFSISNLGMFDVEHFVAIINPPEAAILAVGSVRDVPIVEQGVLGIGQRMKATISVDHRVSDGAEAARFMQELALYLEAPLRLLI